jgi:predicted MFS family arabinose efflux permease
MTAAQEWRLNWPLVFSAMIGLSFGSIPAATLGLFMAPLEQAFGWSRGEISAGMTIFALVGLPLGPLVGILVDRFGARRIVIPGLVMVGTSFAAFGTITGAYWQWIAVWVLYTVSSIFIRSLVFNTAVSGAFLAGRGLAIAVVLAGLAIAQTLAPPLAEGIIASYGWRSAYIVIGLGWAGFALILVLLFFRTRSAPVAPQTGGDSAEQAARPGGISVRQALRSPIVIRIGLAISLQALVGAGVLIHLVPMLTWAGLSRAEAAGLAALLGLASFAGNFVAGWLMDRVRGGLAPLLFFALPALGHVLILYGGASLATLTAAVAVLGVGGGAALQIGIYLTTRYAGVRNFGTIYGIITSFQAGLSGIGPLVAGLIFDATGAYTLVLVIAAPIALLTGLLIFGLGPYPDFTADGERT